MKTLLTTVAAAAVLSTLVAAPASAQPRRGYPDAPTNAQRDQDALINEVPRCRRVIGSLAIVNGDDDRGWRQANLAPPQRLLRVVVQRSGCFTIVDRGAGMNAAQAERALAEEGQLQRRSNVGAGQIRAADYVMTAEVAAADQDTGGGGAAAGIAGALGGRRGAALGGLLGGIQTRRMEANTVLTVTDTRTSEVVSSQDGYATRSNVSFGAGGGLFGSGGIGGAVGGGYENTDIGRVVTAAFIRAYTQLVFDMGGMQDAAPAAARAPRQAYRVSTPTALRDAPSTRSRTMRTLPADALVYPTGQREDMWWEVEDQNENTGWVRNDSLRPG